MSFQFQSQIKSEILSSAYRKKTDVGKGRGEIGKCRKKGESINDSTEKKKNKK
jgi:hypothetical protein